MNAHNMNNIVRPSALQAVQDLISGKFDKCVIACYSAKEYDAVIRLAALANNRKRIPGIGNRDDAQKMLDMGQIPSLRIELGPEPSFGFSRFAFYQEDEDFSEYEFIT